MFQLRKQFAPVHRLVALLPLLNGDYLLHNNYLRLCWLLFGSFAKSGRTAPHLPEFLLHLQEASQT